MKGYKQSATGYRLPKLLSKKQIIEVLKHLDDPVTAMAIFLALFQGLRIGEMTKRRHDPEKALKWENINLETGEMMILDSKNTKRFRIWKRQNSSYL